MRQVRALASVARKLSEQVLIPITDSLPTEGNTHLFVDGGFNIPLIQAVLTPIGNASPGHPAVCSPDERAGYCAYYTASGSRRDG